MQFAKMLQDVLNMERSVISSIERGLEDLKNMKIRVQNEPGRNYIRQDVSMLEYVDYGVATVAKN